MEHNLAAPWTDGSSRPQTPFLAFHSPQSRDLCFSEPGPITIEVQAGLRAVGLRWTLHRNLVEKPFRSGVAEADPANRFRIVIDSAGLIPGFHDLRVELDTGAASSGTDLLQRRPVPGVCTFGWRVADMALPDTRPVDFAAFWGAALERLDATPPAAQEEPLQAFDAAAIGAYNLAHASLPAEFDPAGRRFSRVLSGKIAIAGPDGAPIHGWLARPDAHGRHPAMLVLPGAGVGRRPRPLDHARHGYVALDIQVHGLPVDLERYPDPPGYSVGQVHAPVEAHYYHFVYLRCVQALRYLATRPDVDPARIVVVGGSQGGRLTLVVAALERRVAAAIPAIPHYANLPYLDWVERCNAAGGDGMDLLGAPPIGGDARARCLAYYDTLSFAPDIRCPLLMNAGLIDPVSSPSGVFAVHQRVPGPRKELVVLDGMGHDWSPEFDRRAYRWLDRLWAGG